MIKSPPELLGSPDSAPVSRSAANKLPIAPGDRDRRRRFLLAGIVLLGYLILSVVLWSKVWITGDPSATITCHCGDPSQELWFLSWTPWALTHGHSPFFTNALYSGQGGANMLITTSFILPAIVLAPVTWLFGPIASFNVAATVAPALTAWCFFLAARIITRTMSAQILGGLLFGFSPFVLTNDPFGHLNFTLLFFLPLSFILLHDLFVTHRRSPQRIGVLFATLTIAQFFTGTEVLAISILAIGVALISAALLAPERARIEMRRFATAFGIAAGSAFVVLAYPLWFMLYGPRTISGFVFSNPAAEGDAPSAVINPGLAVHARSAADTALGYFGGIGPNEGPGRFPSLIYFGVPLLLFVAISAVTWYRRRLAWVIVITTVVAWICSFGTSFDHLGPSHEGVWLPWRMFDQLPLLGNVFPLRISFVVTFGIALLFVISLDHWSAILAKALEGARRFTSLEWRPRSVAVTGLTVIGIAVLIPVALTDSIPFAVGPSSSGPDWFSNDAAHLPARTVVAEIPLAGEGPMGQQALAGLHYDLVNGETVVPGSGKRSALIAPSGGAIGVLDLLSPFPTLGPNHFTAAQVEEVRTAFFEWHVGVTVMIQVGHQKGHAVRFMEAVYGRSPVSRDGVWEWRGSPQ